MITLITGVPGSGKTAYALSEMLKFVGKNSDRPLYVHGIPDLKLPHEPVVCSSPGCDCCPGLPLGEYLKADEWHLWAPDGAVLFFDEVQTIHRPRAPASKVPDVIASYEIHRHKGLDFYFITQHPNLFDTNVRRLVSKHIHLTTNWMHRIQYEWSECQSNVQSVTNAVKSAYTLPKNVFKLYKSASLHTKVERKVPPVVWILSVLAIVIFFGVRSIYSNRYVPPSKIESSVQHQTINQSAPIVDQEKITQIQKRFDFKPVVPGYPESAPAYADLAKPVTFPQLAGCMESHDTKKCSCFTQQGTVYEMPFQQCHEYINNPRFNPYKIPTIRTLPVPSINKS